MAATEAHAQEVKEAGDDAEAGSDAQQAPMSREEEGPLILMTPMQRKWLKHFRGKWKLIGSLLIVLGGGAMIILATMWTQIFYPWIFNSKLAFELVVDHEDMLAHDWTYQDFLEYHPPSEPGSRVLSVYLFNVTNPDMVMAGYPPTLQEVGPYSYARTQRRYDVTFSEDDSHTVSYKSWERYEAIDDMSVCREAFFRMQKSEYIPTKMDCVGSECDCSPDDTGQVTAVNPRFFSLLHQHTPEGLLSMFGQTFFAEVERMYTQNFVYGVKAFYAATLLPQIYEYRKFQHGARALALAYAYVESTYGSAQTSFAASHTTSKYSCPSAYLASGETYCTWGTAYYLLNKGFADQAANYTALSAEIPYLLDTSVYGSLVARESSINLWVAAARHLGVLAGPPLSSSRDATDYQRLLSIFCGWGGYTTSNRICRGKVKGLCYYLTAWATTPYAVSAAAEEFARGSNTVICDTDDSTCGWSLLSGGGAGATANNSYYLKAAGRGLANASVSYLLDSTQASQRQNQVNIGAVGRNLDKWAQAYRYCKRTSQQRYAGCTYMDTQRTLAHNYFPTALAANGSTSGASMEMACGIALYLFDGWARNNSYMDRAVAAYVSTLGVGTFNETSLSDVGYAQWGSGSITNALKSVKSTYNLQATSGMWRLSDTSCYAQGPLELTPYAATEGFPAMSLSMVEAKGLLKALANDSAEGDRLRQRLAHGVTTYRGDDTNTIRGVRYSSEAAFTVHSMEADVILPVGSLYHDVSTYLNRSYRSSSSQCAAVQSMYTSCTTLVNLGAEQVGGCNAYETVASDPSYGIVCSAKIVSDETGDHTHPWPRKVAHTLFSMMYRYVWSCVVGDGGLACGAGYTWKDLEDGNVKACGYARGGMFVTAKPRTILFDGYVDPFHLWVNNKVLASRGLSIRCLNRNKVYYTETCDTALSDCTNADLQVLHSTYGVVLNVSQPHNPSAYSLWHEPVWPLPYGLGTLDNPVLAVYQGGMVSNESYQKSRGCDPRYLGGPGSRFTSCVTTIETGRGDLDHIQHIRSYLGNASFTAVQGRGLKWRLAEASLTNQFRPYNFSGFRHLPFPYHGKDHGANRYGGKSIEVAQVDEGVRLTLHRKEEDRSHYWYLQYPTRYRYNYNVTQEVYIPLNRYADSESTWSSVQSYIGSNALHDYLGMPYESPVGMAPTMAMSGFPLSFIGSPHNLANQFYGGQEYEGLKGLGPDESRHAFIMDVDPISGRAVRQGRRMQINLRVERSPFLYQVVSSQRRCPVPTKQFLPTGYGCFMYIPMLWYDDQDVWDSDRAKYFVRRYQKVPDRIYRIGTVGMCLATFLYTVGGAIVVSEWLKHREFRKKVFID